MGEILSFRLKIKPNRKQAMQWLRANISSFPDEVVGFIGPDMFHGWRFISAHDGAIYFANCIDPGISAFEFTNANAYA